MVIPQDERPAGGSIGPDGRFRLSTYELHDGVVIGTHAVAVRSNKHLSERDTLWLVPKKYGSPASSGLSVTIEEEVDDLMIELTWDGKKPYVEHM